MANVHFHIGEVIADPHSTTYEYNKRNNFEITVKTYTDFYDRQELQVIPFNNNIKQIPLVGEHVLLVQGSSAENNAETLYPQWYYLAAFSLNSNVNANLLPGVAPSNVPYTPETSFDEHEVSLLQPYEGDTLVEGRFGNSIRIGSTIKGGVYSTQPSWTGNNSGDPIIILSNGKTYKKDSYIVESIRDDKSSIYLTSTQKVSISLGDSGNKNPLSCYLPAETQFDKSQFIGTADRVILKAKTDIAVIDSPTAIILNTTGEIKLGSDTADQSMVHGDVLLNVLQKILNQLNKPIQCGTMSGTFLDRSNIASAQRQLQNLLSQKYFINKT
jgi:hypothetical protein